MSTVDLTPLTNQAPVVAPIPGTQTPGPTPLTIEQQARLAYPWWPEPLLAKLIDQWVDLGDVNLALAKVRQDPAYEQFFPGNKRADGTLRLAEADYYSTVVGYRNVLRGYGLDPTEFEARGLFAQAITNEVSVSELGRRTQATWTALESDIPALRSFYADYYGLTDLTDQALFASALDTSIGEDIVTRRLTAAQIGGLASGFGFTRGRQEAESLAGMGLDTAQARQLYGRAQAELPTLGSLAERWDASDRTVDIGEYEQALVRGSGVQQRRFQGLVRSEQSSFTEAGAVRRDQEGALIGLRAR